MTFPVKIETKLNETFVNKRQRIEDCTQRGGANPAAALQHNVDTKLL